MRKQVCGMGIGDEIEMWSLVGPPGVQARFPVDALISPGQGGLAGPCY